MKADPSRAERTKTVRTGLSAAGLWVLIEFGARSVVKLGIISLARSSGRNLGSGELFTLSVLFLGPVLLVLGLVFLRLIRKAHLAWTALGYRPWGAAIRPGVIALVLSRVLSVGASRIAASLFGTRETEQFLDAMKSAGLPLAIYALLPVNGVLAPVVEELAWRGYIQMHLVRGWGPATGIVMAAVLFVLKHVIVDLSFSRIVSLLAIGFLLGLLGYRWGTSASTVFHVLLNTIATLGVILEIWHQ